MATKAGPGRSGADEGVRPTPTAIGASETLCGGLEAVFVGFFGLIFAVAGAHAAFDF